MAIAPSSMLSVRVIASASQRGLKTVNIISTAAALAKDIHHSAKQFLQLTAAQTKVGVHQTVMDGSALANTHTFPTIYIAGYTAPN